MNNVVMIGHLADDPKLTTTGSGLSRCAFRIGVRRDFTDKNGEHLSDFFNVVAWRGCADICMKYLHKGSHVCVRGSLQNRNWEDSDGTKRYLTELIAEHVEFLSKANAKNPGTEQAAEEESGFTEVDEDELPF